MPSQRFVTLLVFLLSLFPLTVVAKTATAIFAAGCFWCAEHDFEQVPGVERVISGYTGGNVKNPSYKQVSAGGTGHYEAIEVYYNPAILSYKDLLTVFWKNVDPEDAAGQFCDKGEQYLSVIFYANAKEKQLAEASKQALLKSGKVKTVATRILPVSTFYPAEAYHQDYASKNPYRYKYYRYRCGRDARLNELWQ